ncbi:DUF3859 domain-containing protein [Marinilabiliaceae bacterium JC017]|nr:DUF3859 domain-containing protein [Marinilabiliaceae bacterium JC017]
MEKPGYQLLLEQLAEAKTLDKRLFEALYSALREHHNIEDEYRRWHLQDDFARSVKEIIKKYPAYLLTLRRLLKNDDSLEYVQHSLIRFIDNNIALLAACQGAATPDGVKPAPVHLSSLEEDPEIEASVKEAVITLAGYGASDMVHFINRDYLVLADKDRLRVIDFDKREQVTTRKLSNRGGNCTKIIGCTDIDASTPAHFISISDTVIQAWHLNETEPVFTLEARAHTVFLSHCGSYLVLLDEKQEKEDAVVTVRVYDLCGLKEVRYFQIPCCQVSQVRMTPDAGYLYVKEEKTGKIEGARLLLWSVFGDSVFTHKAIKKHIIKVGSDFAITPDGRYLVSGNHIFTLPEVRFHTCFKECVPGEITISKDGNILAIYSNWVFQFFETITGCCLGKLALKVQKDHPGNRYFSIDNSYFFTAMGGSLLAWDLKNLFGKSVDRKGRQESIRFKEVPMCGIHQLLEMEAYSYPGFIRKEWLAMTVNQTCNGPDSKAPDNKRLIKEDSYIQPTAVPQLSIYNYGIYTTQSQNQQGLPGQASVVVNRAVLIETTSCVKAKVGTCFGMYVLTPAEVNRRVHQFVVKVNHPPIKDGSSGKMIRQTRWNQAIGSGIPFFAGWAFETVAELQAGDWVIEIWNQPETQMLLARRFSVISKEEFHYKVEKLFSGISHLGMNNGVTEIPAKFIIAYDEITFGCRFRVSAPGYAGHYQLKGEIIKPSCREEGKEDEDEQQLNQTFYVQDGSEIDFTYKSDWHNRLREGKWTFKLWDKENHALLLEESYELVFACHLPPVTIEMVDYGTYQFNEGAATEVLTAGNLRSVYQSHDLTLCDDMIFGFRLKLKDNQVGTYRLLRVDLYHPRISNFFSQSDNHTYHIYMEKGKETFVGCILDRPEMLVPGEWHFVLWDPEAGGGRETVFSKKFHLAN